MHSFFQHAMPRASAALALSFLVLQSVPAAGHTASTNLVIGASVPNFCLVSTVSDPFGDYNPIGPEASNDKMFTETVRVLCIAGTSAVITLSQGASPSEGSSDAAPVRRMSDGANHFLSYFLYQDPSREQVWGNALASGRPYAGLGAPTNLTVFGRIPHGQNVPVGSYVDTIVATVAY